MDQTVFCLTVCRIPNGSVAKNNRAENSVNTYPKTLPSQETTNPSVVDTEAQLGSVFQLLSETAHDLRSPLNTIRESIRLVQEGELGDVNDEQEELLSAAISQCQCVDQLVGEMLQVERLRIGMPQARRDWFSIVRVRQAINETLRPWTVPRNIRILWDGAVDPNVRVFGDLAMIRRLVVNLVTNAIRVTPDGEAIMIKAKKTADGASIVWSVIDQGTGVSRSDLERIAQRNTSMSGGEGLGLSICRQLAALHFSHLEIRSRIGFGTTVSFATPFNCPTSVAKNWVKWRLNWARNSESTRQPAGSEKHVRIDNPLSGVELKLESAKPRYSDQICVGTVELGASVPKQAGQSFDAVLQSKLTAFDLSYRIDSRHWVWVLDANNESARRRVDEIHSVVEEQAPQIRLTWSSPREIVLDQERTANRLQDILVRQTLASANRRIAVADRDQVRLGTEPIADSPVAAQRLESEVRRLSTRLFEQAENTRAQTQRIAPPSPAIQPN